MIFSCRKGLGMRSISFQQREVEYIFPNSSKRVGG